MVSEDLYQVLQRRLADMETVEIIKRALAQGVVLDTWMNGEEEEQVMAEAETALLDAAERFAAEAVVLRAVLPSYQMPQTYVRAAFHELLFSTALYAAQQEKGHREVGLPEAEKAIRRFAAFIAAEPEGLVAAGGLFFVISSHEDLNAIAYYRWMKKEEFLFGTLHRPWSNLVLNTQLEIYKRMGLVEETYTGEGDMLALTARGEDALASLRRLLGNAGEIKWRSDNQRWVIFGEIDYDKVISQVLPDLNQWTQEYLASLDLQPGMRVLEVGAGTGRVTVDLGLCQLVGPEGAVVALDPSATLLERLKHKCAERGIGNVQVVQGVGENLPFPDDSFDAAIAVACLHFTDAPRVVAEMARVTKPGGLVSALCPPPEMDVREIPMVATWFHPLSEMAKRLGVPFGERNGLPVGLLEEAFRQSLTKASRKQGQFICSAEDHQSFITFVVKGGAWFQNIFSRLPFHERWSIMRRLEEDGESLARETSPEEKRHVFNGELAYGWVPKTKGTS